MPKWVNAAVLDGGTSVIKNSATQMRLLKTYAAGDSFATVNANTIANAAMVPGDYTQASAGSNRTLTTTSGKTANASAGSGAAPDLHIAFTDGTVVYWVTDETSDQVITSGNPITFPSLVYTTNQPT